MIFTPQQVDLAGGLSLDVPDNWLEIPKGIRGDQIAPYVLNVPISAVLLKANGPLNKELALAINWYFQSPFSSQTLSIALMELLGGRIESVYQRIVFFISPDPTSWRPGNYGSPVYTTTYVPDGQIEDTLILTDWLYETDAPFVDSVWLVVTDTQSASNTQPAGQSLLTPDTPGANSEMTAIRLAEDLGKTMLVMSLDTSGRNLLGR